MNKTFAQYRASVYASINGMKGNLIKLSKSQLLSKEEQEANNKVIEAIETLRLTIFNNRGKKSTL